jgi:tetratricopeptide (TPR) repeat protein
MTAYFNTYYNAGKLFDEAVQEVANTPQPARDTNYFAPAVVPPATAAKFDKVIEKSSKLIQFYPESGLIRGAILMIGKAYTYQGEYDPAFRKFQELIDNFPDGDERFEAKMWLARARYNAKNQDEALALVKALFPEARQEGKDDIMQEALMLEAQIYADRQEYDQAAATYALAVEISSGGMRRAWAQYQLGLAYEKLKSYAKAADAYLRVTDLSPGFALEYRARLKHGMMLSAVGLHTDAIASLEELISEQLRPEEYALADLEIANAYYALGDTAEAFGLYTFIDTTYRRTDASAKSLYRRGLIHEQKFQNFTKAQEYFTRARTEFPASEVTPLAAKKADNFTSYFAISRSMRNFDSLLARALLPDSVVAKMDSVARASDTTKTKAPAPPALGADSTGRTQPGVGEVADAETPNDSALVPPPPALKMLEQINKKAPPKRGRVMAGREDMKSRRQHLNDTEEDPDEEAPSFAATGSAKGDSLRKQKMAAKPIPSGKLTPDSLRTLVAKSNFELASLFFLEMGYPDSALYYFRRVVDKSPNSAYGPKALYGMAEVYRTLGDSSVVDTLYQRILREHGKSTYAHQIRRVLGIEEERAPEDPSVLRYARAESLLVDGKTTPAVKLLKQIANAPASPMTAKAMYTVGWIYENVLADADSATEWYRLLLSSYPDSAYSHVAGPKVAVKDDPTSLENFVKFKKIEPVIKPSKPNFGRRVALERARQPDEDQPGLRNGTDDENTDEEDQDQEEDAEPDDSDDGGQL